MKPRPAVRVRIALLLLFSSLVLCLAVSEVVLRLFFRAEFSQPEFERSFLYRYDAKLGWFPQANSSREFTITRQVRVTHNRKGFRDIEPHPDDRPAIIFLGDSFVWGVDVEAEERFTEKLRPLHPDWNIYNFGVSGYGTDQEFLLLQREFELYHPQIVFLVYCSDNDMKDNSWNMRYGGYYKPFLEKAGGE